MNDWAKIERTSSVSGCFKNCTYVNWTGFSPIPLFLKGNWTEVKRLKGWGGLYFLIWTQPPNMKTYEVFTMWINWSFGLSCKKRTFYFQRHSIKAAQPKRNIMMMFIVECVPLLSCCIGLTFIRYELSASHVTDVRSIISAAKV